MDDNNNNNSNMSVGDDNFQPDPDQDAGFKVGQGEARGQEGGDRTPPAPEEGGKASEIGARLGEKSSGEQGAGDQQRTEAPRPENAMPFDITKLSKEQLQTLKALLNETPDGQIRTNKNPNVTLRRIDGNYVIDFKNAVLGIVKDPETGKDIERHLIPVKFKGTEEFVNVLYSKFINAERVPCEVISHKEEKKSAVEGQVYSREKGRMIEAVRFFVISYFTLKLPEGETIEIEGRLANA